jgi:hypothetical protein
MPDDRPPMGFGFAIMLACLLSLPLWAAIIWCARRLFG